jgi:hypothetical protein
VSLHVVSEKKQFISEECRWKTIKKKLILIAPVF